MKNTLQKITGIFKNPKLWASLIVIFGFAAGTYAFSGPPSGCTPWSCTSPLSVDYVLQRIGIGVWSPQAKLDVSGNIIASAPVANTHVTTKEYVDAAVGAAGDATEDNQTAMMGSGFTTTTDSLTEIRDAVDTISASTNGPVDQDSDGYLAYWNGATQYKSSAGFDCDDNSSNLKSTSDGDRCDNDGDGQFNLKSVVGGDAPLFISSGLKTKVDCNDADSLKTDNCLIADKGLTLPNGDYWVI